MIFVLLQKVAQQTNNIILEDQEFVKKIRNVKDIGFVKVEDALVLIIVRKLIVLLMKGDHLWGMVNVQVMIIVKEKEFVREVCVDIQVAVMTLIRQKRIVYGMKVTIGQEKDYVLYMRNVRGKEHVNRVSVMVSLAVKRRI